jgi:hypothetical protein
VSNKINYTRERELEFWRNSKEERIGIHSAKTISKIEGIDFFKNINVLEIIAGQCWASSILKSLYLNIRIDSVDVSLEALASARIWENIFKTPVDKKYSCSAPVTY